MDKLNKRVEELKATGLKAGYTEERLERFNKPGVELNSLPKTGKFAIFTEPSGEGEFMHNRLRVEGTEHSISLKTVRNTALPLGDTIRFGKYSTGKFKGKAFLRGKSINPTFSKFSEYETIARLEGHSFKATPIECLETPFSENGFDELDEKDLVLKTNYIIELTD